MSIFASAIRSTFNAARYEASNWISALIPALSPAETNPNRVATSKLCMSIVSRKGEIANRNAVAKVIKAEVR